MAVVQFDGPQLIIGQFINRLINLGQVRLKCKIICFINWT